MRTKRALTGIAALMLPIGLFGACAEEDDEGSKDPLIPEVPAEPGEPGVALWSRVIVGAQAWHVATDRDGRIYTAGTFNDKLDFGDGAALVTRGGDDVYLARYAADGKLDWSVTLGSVDADVVRGLASNRFGAPAVALVVFSGSGTLDGACTATPAVPGSAWYLLRIDADTGACELVREVTFDRDATGMPVVGFDDAAMTEDGDLVLAGGIYGKANVGGKDLDTAGAYHGLVARLDGNLDARWVSTFGQTPATHEGLKLLSVDTDASGRVFVTGRLIGASDELGAAVDGQGGAAVVASLDGTGAVTWADTLSGTDSGKRLFVAGDGRVALAGMDAMGDVFVTQVDASGAVGWATPLTGSATLHVDGVALQRDGHVSLAVGADPLQSGTTYDVLIGRERAATRYLGDDNGMLLGGLDAEGGAERWSLFYGGSSMLTSFSIPRAMTVAPTDDTLLLVGQAGNVDLGAGQISGYASFVARIPQ